MQHMCMKPRVADEIPADTQQLGRALLKPDNVMRIIGERLSDFIHDDDFADLYPPEGRPALWPGVLALVTVLQWAEAVSDRQAAYLVVTRLDWKYVLHLPLNYPGFDYSVLSEFRQRLLAQHAEQRVFEKLLVQLKTLGLVRGRGVQRTDSMAVLSAVTRLTRLELIYETLRLALMTMKRTDATWFQRMIPQRFVEEYGERGEQERWVKESGEKGHAAVQLRAAKIGQDGQWLLERIAAADTPKEMQDLPEVATLRTVWAQQFEQRPPLADSAGGPVPFALREHVASAGAETICTPHDPETRYSTKRGHEWEGYKLHLTETVDEAAPRIITDIRTTLATTADFDLVEPIQEKLVERDVAPAQQLLDMGYVSGRNIAQSSGRGIELIGPARVGGGPQRKLPDGVTLSQFELDYAQQVAHCPGGQTSVYWRETGCAEPREIHIRFAGATCGACPLYARCVTRKGSKPQGRILKLRGYHEVLAQQRVKQKTEQFKELYRHRAGIEATLSLGVRTQGLRVSRYIGLKKTSLQHSFIAVACNLKRAAWWLAGRRAQARGRRPKIMALPVIHSPSAQGLPVAA